MGQPVQKPRRHYGKIHPLSAEYARYPVPVRAIRPFKPAQVKNGWRALKSPSNIRKYGTKDAEHANAVRYYSPPFFRDIFGTLTAHVRQILDYDIVETYYYARLYGTGDDLKLHTDRGASFIATSICFGYEYSPMFPEGSAWPIGVLEDSGDGQTSPVMFPLQPGDGILYPGCSVPHWRDIFLGKSCGQAFFFWVPKDDAMFGSLYGDPDMKG